MPKRSDAPLDPQAFGRNFARLLKPLIEKGTSARAFASDVGVGEDRISKWRRGRLPVPDTSTLIKIAVRFNVSVDALLAGVHSDYQPRAESAHAKKSKESDLLRPEVVVQGSPTPVEFEQPLGAGGNHRDAAASFSLSEEYYRSMHVVQAIVDHALAIAQLSASLPPDTGRPEPRGRDKPERVDRDPVVRHTGTHGRKHRR